jgi:hypothetical protein
VRSARQAASRPSQPSPPDARPWRPRCGSRRATGARRGARSELARRGAAQRTRSGPGGARAAPLAKAPSLSRPGSRRATACARPTSARVACLPAVAFARPRRLALALLAAPKAPCSLTRLAARCCGGPRRAASPTPWRSGPARPWSRLWPRPRHGIAAQPPSLPPACGHRSVCGLPTAVRSAQARRGSRSAVGPAGATRPVPWCGRACVSGAASRSAVGVAKAGRLGLCATPAQQHHRRPRASP